MPAHVSNGKLRPAPSSYEEALARRVELAEDLASIEHQLSDGKIALGMTAYQYDAWHHKTKEAQRLRKQEQPLLEKWIVDHLLHRTYELLKEMELEVVFLPGDAKLMEQLDDHHAKRTS